ncbi:MAG: YkuS family protein [Halanaerobiaceae bacterium]
MKMKIAVEDGLSNVKEELEESGYEVIELNNDDLQDAAAVVVSGEDNNMMDISETKTAAPIINARGMTAVDVRKAIEKRQVKI